MQPCYTARSVNALLALWALGTGACSGDNATLSPSVDADPRRICDGSTDIRLAFSYHVQRTSGVDGLLYDLGLNFLYIDGKCRYWVQAPTGGDDFVIWRPYHTGKLTRAQEQGLHDMVGYDDFSAGPAAGFCTPQEIAYHAAFPKYWDGEKTHSCKGKFTPTSADWPMRKELYKQGVELTGAVRVVVDQQPAPDGVFKVYPWPFSASPQSLYLGPEGPSQIIPEGDEASALRALRDLAIQEASALLWPGGILAEPEGYERELDFTFMFSVRDELPFTDADGRWAP